MNFRINLAACFFIYFFSLMAHADIFGCNNFGNFVNYDKILNARITRAVSQEPSPIKNISLEGILPNTIPFQKSITAMHDLDYMQSAAIAWKAGIDKEKSFFVAKKYLLAWVSVYTPNYNPVDEERLSQLIKTYAIIKNKLSSDDISRINLFLLSWGNGYINRMNRNDDGSSQWKSNWQSHRIRLVTLIAVVTNDKNLLSKAKQAYIRQLQLNIYRDGSTWDFKERDALRYVVGDLSALLDAALAAKTLGEDWYKLQSPTGSSLSNAISWLIPYVNGNIKHEEFKNTSVEFDKVRAKNNVSGYKGYFNPTYAANILWVASLFDSKLYKYAYYLQKEPPFYYRQCFY
ncbi:alginate lyase family protein [Raoultella ornithinolytica]|uniref:alginate lyase family protein n=2 Tax=Raoultella ornithinolytica TaxID=54291 RepID=UPI0015DEEA1A|nr:alginate lyase family protein [Raoultella ornithinolytica]WPO17354.1 alginate lyase family protein [Raoultella ornithinolytica]